ncbi:unnamed protein product [Blumeria hordei]|uniref:Secreted effector protein n=1 Tax=Blumeria hordei TaxID=2867405 RepID=A0A383UW57_BLUHO|nr:unnamed protein product [Blumeria hordei]
MRSSILTSFSLLFSSYASASSIPGASSLERRHGQTHTQVHPINIVIVNDKKNDVHKPFFPTFGENDNFKCGKKIYKRTKIMKSLSKGCQVYKEQRQKSPFPSVFTAFQTQSHAPLLEWPLRWRRTWFLHFRGSRRVVFDDKCCLVGLVIRKRDGKYETCNPVSN